MIRDLYDKFIGRYFGYFRFFYGYLGGSVFLALLANLLVAVLDGIGLSMFMPLLQTVQGGEGGADSGAMGRLSFVLDFFVALGIPATLTGILFLMLVFFLLKGLARYASQFYRVVLMQRFTNALRQRLMRLLAGLRYEEFAGSDSGTIQNSMSGEIQRVSWSYHHYFTALQELIMLAVYVGLAALANAQFALMVGIGGMTTNIFLHRLYKGTKQASDALTGESHRFQGLLLQAVSNFKYLKSTGLIGRYRDMVDGSVESIERYQRRLGVLSAMTNSVREPFVVGVVVVSILLQVVYLGGSMGAIILSMLFLYRGLNSLVAFQNSYNSFLGNTGSLHNTIEFERLMASGQEPAGNYPYEGLREAIELCNLSYAYGHQPVLRKLNLTIRRNHTVGIVGGSGVGKTTLVNIICGLLRVEPGMMRIDGRDGNDVNRVQYRNAVGYVTQEAPVFADTIYNNVSFWTPPSEESHSRVWEALRLAHADDFVRELPEGLRTRIGINGMNLSGGQRQRLAIARELYRKVDLLVFDEATSALDSQSEQLIQRNIDSLAGRYTMLIIAHRLSTVRKADTIIHLQPDGAYEIGTFESLMVSSPTFQDMVAVQSIG